MARRSCAHCGNESTPEVRLRTVCKVCREAHRQERLDFIPHRYCGRECQLDDYPRHKLLCVATRHKYTCRKCEQTPGRKLSACGSCRRFIQDHPHWSFVLAAYYCGERCQKADWRDHKHVCFGRRGSDPYVHGPESTHAPSEAQPSLCSLVDNISDGSEDNISDGSTDWECSLHALPR